MHATHANSGSSRDTRTLLKAALAGGGLFLLWRACRALGTVFWAVSGITIAIFWSGIWRFMVP